MLPCGFPIKPTSILRVSALFFISCGDNTKNVTLNNNNNDVKQTVCERDYLHIIVEAEDIFENVTLKTARYQYQ